MGSSMILSGNIPFIPDLPSQLTAGWLAKPVKEVQAPRTLQNDALIRCQLDLNSHWNLPGQSGYFRTLLSSRLSNRWLRQLEQRCPALVSNQIVEERAEVQETKQLRNLRVKHILCLSNGHGEDTIAVSVLKELTVFVGEGHKIDVDAIPLVGVGSAYSRNGIQLIGPSKLMPSGGFIYMDILQLLGDMRAGLIYLTIQQAIEQWLDRTPNAFIVAVGDIFPLALAWLASIHMRKKHNRTLEYAFIGTAKSEFYIKEDPESNLSTRRRFHVESLLGGVYLPWERAIMADANCRLVAPRDALTAEVLRKTLPTDAQAKVQDLGNPMMDGLDPSGALVALGEFEHGHCITILPGSRAPEVHRNWLLLLETLKEVSAKLQPRVVVYITPIVPSLEPGPFYESLVKAGWQPYWAVSENLHSCHAANATSWEGHQRRAEVWPANCGLCILEFHKDNAVMLLLRGGFSDGAHWAEAAIAMAGTGTEQLVGLGKPVFTQPGSGPQFTYAFAEAQSRLLGKSIFLHRDPQSLATKLSEVLADKDSFQMFVENGRKRMGCPGGSRRIANEILNSIE